MISVADALANLFALTKQLPVETVPLAQANGRTLAEPVSANRDQPPFSASAMDGYAIVSEGSAPGKAYQVIGEAAAGHAFEGPVAAGQAVRIFTGSPVPKGATRVIIQEDVRRDGDTITLSENLDKGLHIRPLGGDFKVGQTIDIECLNSCVLTVSGGNIQVYNFILKIRRNIIFCLTII